MKQSTVEGRGSSWWLLPSSGAQSVRVVSIGSSRRGKKIKPTAELLQMKVVLVASLGAKTCSKLRCGKLEFVTRSRHVVKIASTPQPICRFLSRS